MPLRLLTIGRHRLACEAARALLLDADVEFLDHLEELPQDWQTLERLNADILLVESDTPEETLSTLITHYHGPLPWQVVVFSIRDDHLRLYHYEQRPLGSGQALLEALQDLAS